MSSKTIKSYKMKIDKIIDAVKGTTDEITIIANKKTIKRIFDDIDEHTVQSIECGFKLDNNNLKVQSLNRNSVTVHFIDSEDINEESFIQSIKEN